MPNLSNHLEINRCPHCNVDSPSLPTITDVETRNHKGENLRYWRMYACSRCGGIVTASAKSHMITEDMAKWAHEVRLDANDQRHADEGAALPDEGDARRAVDFAMALGQFLFVLPSRVKRGLADASGAHKPA